MSKGPIRFLIRRDLQDVLDIEWSSFGDPWTEAEFMTALKKRNMIGTVYESENTIQGFMLYTLHQGRLEIVNIAVHPDYRLRGIGLQLLERLKAKLSPERRTRVAADVTEQNLPGQLFFSSCGFRCVGIKKDVYESSDGEFSSAYRFEHSIVPRPSIRNANIQESVQ